MEEKTTAPADIPQHSVAMDVVAPPHEKAEHPAAHEEADPVDQLAAEDQKAQAAIQHKSAQPHPAQANGVTHAIVATVIIVLTLAVLATFAYIQTAK